MRTRRHLPLVAFLIALTPGASSGQGFNLSWDDCGSTGTLLKAFACDTDAGAPFALVGSFVPPPGIGAFTGIVAEVGFQSSNPAMSDWWKFGFAPCRSGVGLGVDVPTSGNCLNPYSGVVSASHAYDIAPNAPGACMTLRVSADPSALDHNLEYYAFRVLVSRTGTSNCRPACFEPLCIGINWIRLEQSPGIADVVLNLPSDRHFVNWQTGTPGCPPTDVYDHSFGTCDRPTAPRRSTWGSIRALYR